MTRTLLKLYGERNTGTNYLERLAALNLDATVLPGSTPPWLRRLLGEGEGWRDVYFRLTWSRNLGWKHAVAPSPQVLERKGAWAKRLAVITLTKNPYSWLLSLHRNPYHQQGTEPTFEAFLETPWQTVGRERHTGVFPHPVALWNVKNASYLALAGGDAPCANLKYEDLLADPEATLRGATAACDLAMHDGPFRNVTSSTKGEAGRDFQSYQDTYLYERWKANLTTRSIDFINRYLDPALMTAFGYEWLPGSRIEGEDRP